MPLTQLSVKQQGSTIIEVLISVLVLSVGLLGVASMQLHGLRYNQGAYLRAQATILAYDIVDRMRANPDGVAAGYYNSINTSSLPTDPACISTGCTNQQLADHDIREWGNYFVGGTPMLPAATATVAKTLAIYTVTVSWTELARTGAIGQSVVYTFQM